MFFLVLAYLSGVLTILSPCILPVLPFVLARAGQSFVRSGLPLLLGMALTFAATATLAAVGGSWAVHANQYGRWAALALLALFAATLLFPALSARLTRPLVAVGNWLSAQAESDERAGSTLLPSFILGVATGLLWAPCAGPILGLVLTGAALHGASVMTTVLLFAYAAGAATSLALALLAGGRIAAVMKRSLVPGDWLRKFLGIAVLGGVAVIALGLDNSILVRLSAPSTAALEQSLLGGLGDPAAANANAVTAKADGPVDLPVEGELPSLAGAVEWLNSPPLTAAELRNKVVLVNFWTYSCINCLRSLPYSRAWADKYRDQGLVVIGVHAPEFAFEKKISNVKSAIAQLEVNYPVAVDNNFAIWRGFNNQFWPAYYLVDANGKIRYHHFGEGGYETSEKAIQQLLAEAGRTQVSSDMVTTQAKGAQVAADMAQIESGETYVGYERAENFASQGGQVRDHASNYALPPSLSLNYWGLAGNWNVKNDKAVLEGATGRIAYRFHARDLHLVLGPGASGKPVHFRIRIDGKPPGEDHGTDVDAQGEGTVSEERLYQLVRQKNGSGEHVFEIEFLSPGAEAFAFTFG